MKYIFLILFSLLLVVSCNESHECETVFNKAWFVGLVNDEYSKKVRDSLLPEAEMQAEDLYEQEDCRWVFIYTFFEGYVFALENVGGEVFIGTGPNPSQDGFDCGMAFYRRRVETVSQDLCLEDFGFELLTAEGTYQWDSEMSEFYPVMSNERWWVEFRKGILESLAKSSSIDEDALFDEKKICKFKGYLAPDYGGGVGHFNMYDREFIVIEILEVK